METTGKKYKTDGFCWMLYPSQEGASFAARWRASSALRATAVPMPNGYKSSPLADFATNSADARATADYWNARIPGEVTFLDPNSTFTLLEVEDKFYKISTGVEVGWIIVSNFNRHIVAVEVG
jgi:hypothetical protein